MWRAERWGFELAWREVSIFNIALRESGRETRTVLADTYWLGGRGGKVGQEASYHEEDNFGLHDVSDRSFVEGDSRTYLKRQSQVSVVVHRVCIIRTSHHYFERSMDLESKALIVVQIESHNLSSSGLP